MTEEQKQNNEKITSEDYENLLDKYQFSSQEVSPGKIVSGRVVKVMPSHILVDIGLKSEGVIPIEDFTESAEAQLPKVGDTLEAVLEKTDSKEGYFVLSKRQADERRALELLEKSFEDGSSIPGRVVERIKNGYTVNVGLRAFMPDSHAELRPLKDPAKLVGQTIKVKVIKYDRKTENAVVSHKAYLMEERDKKKKIVFSQIQKGQKLKGFVRSLTSFGAFVDIGGVEGLLHVSDMIWGKIANPHDLFKVGQEVEVLVLDFNEKDEKISLGTKQLSPNPWDDIEAKYKPGDRVEGKVSSLTDFGAFVELEPGIEGLVHISDLTWSRKMIHPKKLLNLGDKVTVSILDVNPTSRRISLGLKQTQPHPLEQLKLRLVPGMKIKGKITSITDFGAFMEVEPGIEGLIHISDISWEKIKHPSAKLKVGDEAEAVLLNIDVEKQKVSLGIKQLEGDIWEEFFIRQKIGDLLNVKIVRIAEFGVFAEILPGIEGVVFNSEIDEKKVENPADVVSVGDEKTAKIIKMNPRDKKISLSFRQAQTDLQKQEYQKYQETQDERLTFGDLIKDQLRQLQNSKKAVVATPVDTAADTAVAATVDKTDDTVVDTVVDTEEKPND
jgi:small subunit ribosomal protein S1